MNKRKKYYEEELCFVSACSKSAGEREGASPKLKIFHFAEIYF